MNRSPDHRHFLKKIYLPTKAEIAETCQQIQAGWSDHDRWVRTAYKPDANAKLRIVPSVIDPDE